MVEDLRITERKELTYGAGGTLDLLFKGFGREMEAGKQPSKKPEMPDFTLYNEYGDIIDITTTAVEIYGSWNKLVTSKFKSDNICLTDAIEFHIEDFENLAIGANKSFKPRIVKRHTSCANLEYGTTIIGKIEKGVLAVIYEPRFQTRLKLSIFTHPEDSNIVFYQGVKEITKVSKEIITAGVILKSGKIAFRKSLLDPLYPQGFEIN